MGGWFHRKVDGRLDLEPGWVFRNIRPGNVVELAKVHSVTNDSLGIPHVRFDMTLFTPGQTRLLEGRRVLCLASFTKQFTERVSA